MVAGGVVYLIDTSAAVRLFRREGMKEWGQAQSRSLIGLCDLTDLEIQYSARSTEERERVRDLIAFMFPWVPIPDRVFDRAREVQGLLTEHGWHRSAGPVDLLVAATAELSGLTLVHQDGDFETIGKVTGQETRWLLPSSSTN